MYLYLASNPRILYLVTSSHDERLGRPSRALVFRPGDGPSKTIVEFLPTDQVDFSSLVRLTNRVVKGCIGLIAVENGRLVSRKQRAMLMLRRDPARRVSGLGYQRHGYREHQAIGHSSRICSAHTRSLVLQPDLTDMGRSLRCCCRPEFGSRLHGGQL